MALAGDLGFMALHPLIGSPWILPFLFHAATFELRSSKSISKAITLSTWRRMGDRNIRAFLVPLAPATASSVFQSRMWRGTYEKAARLLCAKNPWRVNGPLRGPSGSQSRALLVVENGGRDQASIAHRYLALLGVCAGVPVGVSLLILASIARRRPEWDGFLRHWTITQPGSLPGALLKVSPRRTPKQAVDRAFSVAGRFNLNHSALCLIILLMLLWTVFVIQQPYLPHGFAIRTLPPSVKLVPIAGLAPLRIRILAGNSSMRGLQVGSKVIDPADFEAFLRREIPKRPPDWPVYIEGESSDAIIRCTSVYPLECWELPYGRRSRPLEHQGLEGD